MSGHKVYTTPWYSRVSRISHEVFVLRNAKGHSLSARLVHAAPQTRLNSWQPGRTISDRGFSSLGKQAASSIGKRSDQGPVFQIWWHRILGHSSLVDACTSTCVSRTTHAVIFPERRTTSPSPRSATLALEPRQDVFSNTAKANDMPRRSLQNQGMYNHGHKCHPCCKRSGFRRIYGHIR